MNRQQVFEAVVAGTVLLTFLPPAATAAPAKEETTAAPDKVLVVNVTFQNKPVEGAQVAAIVRGAFHASVTGRDGTARVPLPPDGKINGLVAVHPQLGLEGRWFGPPTRPAPPGGVFQFALAVARPHVLRIVQADGRPVPNVKGVIESVYLPAKRWIQTRGLPAAQFQTNRQGEAPLAWIPRELGSVIANVVDERWKRDECSTGDGFTTLKVSPLQAVRGRLRMPNGVPPEGLAIAGAGWNESFGWDHKPSARVRRDGTFTIYLAAGDAYSIEMADPNWASDAWLGVVPRGKPAPEIELAAYPATRLSVRVTRGPRHEPVADAWISLSSVHNFTWKNARGKAVLTQPGVQTGLSTDADGTARFSVGKGDYALKLVSEKWREERSIPVTAAGLVSVDFDRPWIDKRTIAGRLMLQHKPHKTGPATIVRAWCISRPAIAGVGAVQADGRFTVDIDAADVYLFAVDAKERLSAARQLGPADSTADLELVPTGAYSGAVVDSSGKPLAGHGVQLAVGGANVWMHQVVLQSATCDERGRFKFDSAPARTPLFIFAGIPASARGAAFSMRSDEFHVDSELEFYLDPGEARTNVELVAKPENSGDPPRESLEHHLKRLTRDVRLAGMRLLVILQGDASKSVSEWTEQLRGSDDPPEILRYQPLVVAAEEIQSEAPLLSHLGWERPHAGQIEMIAIDGTGATLGARRIRVNGNAAAERQAAEFIKGNAPPRRDARALLASARQEARETQRRLWIVEGGPRCRPCFELARWMDDQHALLSKDYVILKVLETDQRYREVIGKFNPPRGAGIPWFAIADADGAVLVTSDGPLGNTGFPSTFEDKRHLKAMLDRTARHLTAAERDRLIESLGNGP